MENNAKVARAHFALCLLYGLLTVLFAVVILNLNNGPSLAGMYVILAFFAGLSVLHYFTGKKAKERRAGARRVSMIIAVFMLFGFPLGTMIGIYLLTNTWKPWDAAPQNTLAG